MKGWDDKKINRHPYLRAAPRKPEDLERFFSKPPVILSPERWPDHFHHKGSIWHNLYRNYCSWGRKNAFPLARYLLEADVSTPLFDSLADRARRFPPLTMAVVDAGERSVLEGVALLAMEKIVSPILIGNPSQIQKISSEIGLSQEIPVVPAHSDEDAARMGVGLVKEGGIQILMKGHSHSDTFLHPILEGLRRKKRLSHVYMAELSTYGRFLFITDAAMNIAPDLEAKAQILQNAIDMAHCLGIQEPKVAALSAVETVNPRISSTIDAACLAKMADRGQIKGAIVDGPLAFDNAISQEAAKTKGISSPVSGSADILLLPDLVSGNILAKDLEYLAGATLAGIILGASVPVILTSRSDPPRSRFLSACIATLLWHAKPREYDGGDHEVPFGS